MLTTNKTWFLVQNFVFLWYNLGNKIPSFIPFTPTKAEKKKMMQFSWPWIWLSAQPHDPSPTNNQNTLKEQRLTKSSLLPFPNRFFTQTLQYQNSKSNNYYILIKLGPSVSESSTNISHFYALTDSEQKFHKAGVENWLLIGFGLGFPLIGNPLIENPTDWELAFQLIMVQL